LRADALRIALVITTYERPDALSAVLETVAAQIERPDEIIVADDGSGAATRDAILRHGARFGAALAHLRQEKRGFRLARLRNLAIAEACAPYIVFVDGDMLLHPWFIADHRRLAQRGYFTQGVRVLLDERATAQALRAPGMLPRPWGSGQGILRRFYTLHHAALAHHMRLVANHFVAIKGCNQAYWRDDLVAVNGYNEQIEGWGPEDKELCARLLHLGVRRQTLLFGGIAWHLAHAPSSRQRRDANQAVLDATLASRSTRCERGLDAHRSQL
jgi:glycosyltransferase involved in cell wall biosynthesis